MSAAPSSFDDDAAGRQSDRAFLGLEMDDGALHGSARIGDRLLTPDGRFYGGAGICLAAAAMEAATGRRLRWITTQFASSSGEGAEIDISVNVEASGHVTSQVLVAGRVDGTTLFNAIGSTGVGRSSAPDATFASMPSVRGPEDCKELKLPMPEGMDGGHLLTSELRSAGVTERPSMLVWARAREHDASRPALLGYVADYLPLAVMVALGKRGGGASLDNTIRVGASPAAPSPWVLVELLPELVADDYGHGRALLWSEAGEQLGIASQTMRLRVWPE